MIKHSFADNEPNLWKAVIARAILDMALTTEKSEERLARMQAKTWVGSKGFRIVAIAAGYDPEWLEEQIRLAEERDFRYKLPNGYGWRSKKKQQGVGTYEHERRRINRQVGVAS